ncbi:MAG: SUMF1/EgtB/PvdO family nonheme iron enzyme [Arenicellales bacterium]|jgi:formylglycine-generating enzyme required for sulfatase activity|nr:SUMF1/EgtB/PvdO family nonheme iron enzyme [Arenicellales bacterium]MDP7398987.1 SUMF1/EgtB/PvdO family nonheme iron enzyme [Lentisphaeria bacterium]
MPALPGENWTSPTLNIPFVWIEAVGMWVAKNMIANDEYRRFRPDHDSGDYEGHSLSEDRQPAVGISYDDAGKFCEWLTERDIESGELNDQYIFRVPSHNEWTRLARCGDGRIYPWGNEWPPKYGNFSDESAHECFPGWEPIKGYNDGFPVTCPVEEAGENDWGLVGLGGNAYEWTFEAEGTSCELRGGSFSTNQAEYLHIDNRYRREPSSRLINFGFRPVLLK